MIVVKASLFLILSSFINLHLLVQMEVHIPHEKAVLSSVTIPRDQNRCRKRYIGHGMELVTISIFSQFVYGLVLLKICCFITMEFA